MAVRALLLIVLLLLVALNGLFVAAEIGLVRSRRARLEVMANEGERGAEQALQQIDRMAEYIAACQVGITLTSIGIGFLGEPALAKLLEPVFGGALARRRRGDLRRRSPSCWSPPSTSRSGSGPEDARDSAGRDALPGDWRGRLAPSG